MSEKVEHVAQALANGHGLTLQWRETAARSLWDILNENGRDEWRRQARLAIAAMRVPTADMAPPAYEAFDKAEPDGVIGPNGLVAVWQAMIDEALK